MTCPKCQKQLEANSSRCSNCGFELGLKTTPGVSAPLSFDPFINLVLKEKFQLVERLGIGAMGSVYRAKRLGRPGEVAVKILHQLTDPAAVDRFSREADNALRLAHESIVKILDVERGDDTTPPYLVMELLEGIPLSEILVREGKLTPKRAISLMSDICDAVSFAHAKGVIHRDLKPANIVVLPAGSGRKDETVKIVDFGLAKFRDPRNTALPGDSSTMLGTMIGTPLYMSPEACRGEKLDVRSDVYSLGATLYHMLSGKPPFTARSGNVMEIVAKHLSEKPPPLNGGGLSVELERVVMLALEKDPNSRPQNAIAFAESLRRAIEARVSPSIVPELKEFTFERIQLKNGVEEKRAGTARYFSEKIGWEDIDMVEIPSGTFVMGSPKLEWGRKENEGPQREVQVRPFFIGRYEVTQAEWRAVASLDRVDNDLDPNPSDVRGDRRPVENVSWYDAVEFCKRLSRKTGREYRLPTEAEWEYACRAGANDPFHCGDNIHPELVNYDGNYPYFAGSQGLFRETTTDVGSVGCPNNFGLFDMLGNVWEWCQDVYHRTYDGAPGNGAAWLGSDQLLRVVRGGSWRAPAKDCGSAARNSNLPRTKKNDLGFRVVCSSSSPVLQTDPDPLPRPLLTSTAILTADLIGSKKLASQLGGHAKIHDLCQEMRNFLDARLEKINADGALDITHEKSEGDDIKYHLGGPNVRRVADGCLEAVIAAVDSCPSGKRFRYVVYRIDSDTSYLPRIKSFSDISKTEKGRQYHIAVDRGLVSKLANPANIDWLKNASPSATTLDFMGEGYTGVYVDLYAPVSTDEDAKKKTRTTDEQIEIAQPPQQTVLDELLRTLKGYAPRLRLGSVSLQANRLITVLPLFLLIHVLMTSLTIDLCVPSIFQNFMEPALWGLVLGAAQALLFRRHLSVAIWWIVVTLIGAIVAGLIYQILHLPWELTWSFIYGNASDYPLINPATTIIVFGTLRWLIIAVAQWLVLRKLVSAAVLWPLATVAAALICSLVIVSFPKGTPFYDVFMIYAASAGILLGIAQASCIIYFKKRKARAKRTD